MVSTEHRDMPQEILNLDFLTLLLVHSQEYIVFSYCACQNAPYAIIILLCTRKPSWDPADVFNKQESHHNLWYNHKVENILVIKLKINDRKAQLQELASNDMCKTFFPNLSKICMWNLSLIPCHDSFSRKALFLYEAN